MTTDTIRIYCDRQPEHERRGRTWIETLERSRKGPTAWHAAPPKRGQSRYRDNPSGSAGWFDRWIGADHDAAEVALSDNGDRLTEGDRKTLAYGDYPGTDALSTANALSRLTEDPEAEQAVSRSRRKLDDARIAYAFKCPTCTLTVPIRGERLWPILDKLADNGIGELSLDTLSGLVSRQ